MSAPEEPLKDLDNSHGLPSAEDFSSFATATPQTAPLLTSPVDQQAHEAIRGYVYQCWLSVEKYLNLSAGDLLFVECAEDIAVFAGLEARLVQAKALAGSLSLRSEEIAEAINHMGAFRRQRPHASIYLSFVTTAHIRPERGDPLTIPGLQLWLEIANSRDLSKAGELQRFIVNDSSLRAKLHGEILEEIGSISPAEFWERYVSRIVLEMGQPEEAGIRDTVVNRLAVVAERSYGQSATNAQNIASKLLQQVLECAGSKEKFPLTADSLHKTIRSYFLPVEIAALTSSRNQLLGGSLAAGQHLPSSWRFSDIVEAIHPIEELSRRIVTLRDLKEHIAGAFATVIGGSSGMGKSTLAQLLAADFGGTWLLVRQEDQLARGLRAIQECTALVAANQNPTNFIFDDLPWDDLDAGALKVVSGLLSLARRRGCHVIFTNQRPPLDTTAALAGLPERPPFIIPPLCEDEVADLLSRMGCTDARISLAWGKLLLAVTSGHPQLCHAQAIQLRRRGWPAPSLDEFTISMEANNAIVDKASYLLKDLTDGEIEILTRCCAMFSSFRRDHAIGLANELERIPSATIRFEALRGPWIESVGADRFKLSPMLGKRLLMSLPPERIQAIHAAAAAVHMRSEPFEAIDASPALLNCILGRQEELGGHLIVGLLQVTPEATSALHGSLAWALVPGFNAPWKPNGLGATLFAVLQFEVSASAAPNECDWRFDKALGAIESMESDTDEVTLVRLALSISVLRLKDAHVAAHKLFWTVGVLGESVEQLARYGIAKPEKVLPEWIATEGTNDDVEAFVAQSILAKVGDMTKFLRFLRTIDEQPAADRATQCRVLCRVPETLIRAFDRIWLAEHDRETRNWAPVLAFFNEVRMITMGWPNQLFLACAARCEAIIYNEYLFVDVAARVALQSVDTSDPTVASIVEEQLGKIELRLKNYRKAQGHFEAALPNCAWRGFTRLGESICIQNAGTAAGEAGDWRASASHFANGAKIALLQEGLVRWFGFVVDGGYSWFRAGEYSLAVSCFSDALERRVDLPDGATDIMAFRAVKLCGHVLSDLAWGTTIKRGDRAPVEVGMCSSLFVSERMRELPPTSPGVLWICVCTIAIKFGVMPERLLLRLIDVSHSGDRAERFLGCNLLAAFAVAFDQGSAPTHALALAMCMQRPGDLSSPDYQNEDCDRRGVDLGGDAIATFEVVLGCCLATALIRGRSPGLVLDEWQRAEFETDVRLHLEPCIGRVSAVFSLSLRECAAFVKREQAPLERLAGAVRILAEKVVSPNDLLVATVGVCLVLGRFPAFEWAELVVRDLDTFVSSMWRHTCESPFLFRSPSRFLPVIRRLAGSPSGILSHLAAIVTAAVPALDVSLSPGVADYIETLARKEDSR